MKISKATHDVPNEIEFQTPSTTMPMTPVGKALQEEEDDDDVIAFRDFLEEDDNTHEETRQEVTTPSLKKSPIKCERQSAIDDISLTGDTAPSSSSLIKQATIGSLPKSHNNAVSAKTNIPLPIQNLNALARSHLSDCGGLPISLVADDDLVKNMRVGVGIAGNVAGRAATNAPGSKEVIHGVKAGIAYAEETAQSAKKLISDTKQFARDMDIKKFAASSASYSFEDEMFRLSDETGQSEDASRSGSNSDSTKTFRYTDSDETSFYSKDDLDAETMHSSFVTENPSGIYTASVAPSTAEDLSFVPPRPIMSSRARRTQYRSVPPKAMKRVAPIVRRSDQDEITLPAEARDHRPAEVDTNGNVLGAPTTVNDGRDDDSEYTEVTYLSEHGVDEGVPTRNQENVEGIQENVEGTNNHENDGDSSDYTEITEPDENNTGTANVDSDDASNRYDIADRVISEPSERTTRTCIITTTQTKSPEQILADNTVDVTPLKVEWIDPPPEQASLIAAALSTSIGRRSNACGTIKMIASNKKKAAGLARTRILLDALILAINDGIQTGEEKDLYLEAQSRATIAISHLSEVKENRVLLAKHPGMVKALIDLIRIDKGEARVAACRSLVMMSKVQQNKMALVKTDGFVALFSDIMGGRYDQRTEGDEGAGISSSFSSTHSKSNGGSRSQCQSQCQSRGNSSRGGSGLEANSSASRGGSLTIRQCKSVRYQEYLSLARVNCCAAFSHLAKDCVSSAILCKDKAFIGALLSLCSNTRTPMYKRCIEMMVHLTRFSGNCEVLASNGDIVKVLVTSGKAKDLEERLCALRSFQNISAVCAESRMIFATDSVIGLLISSAFEGTKDEQEASLGTILNLALETGTFVNLTNTKNFTAVLIHVINSTDASSISRERARQVLRLIANWMNTLADTGNDKHTADNTTFKPTGWMLYT